MKLFGLKRDVYLPAAVAVITFAAAVAADLKWSDWLAVGLGPIVTIFILRFDDITKLTLGKEGFAVELRQAKIDALSSKTLALLSVELALENTIVPAGRMDGGLWSRSDAIYKRALKGMTDLGMTDEEMDEATSVVDPLMARRIFTNTASKKLGSRPEIVANVSNPIWRAAEARLPPPDPDKIVEILVSLDVPQQEAEAALEDYRYWFTGAGRLRRAIEIFERVDISSE